MYYPPLVLVLGVGCFVVAILHASGDRVCRWIKQSPRIPSAACERYLNLVAATLLLVLEVASPSCVLKKVLLLLLLPLLIYLLYLCAL